MQDRHIMHFTHCTNIRRLRQVRNRRAIPGVGLTEMNVRHRRVNEVLVVVSPSYKIGHKRQKGFMLTTCIQVMGEAEID
jgi:hypothetical protein